ncbi:putative F-box protein At1g46840 [Rosa chinensis]|nr:putative F-box protein At1g46840 [Rosa chinensis]
MVRSNKRNKESSLKAIKLPKLPFDTIIEILSWVPVVSLLRCKCVCKQWCSLIQDDKFVLKHMDRSRPTDQFYRTADEKFKFISTYGGLCLERSLSNSRVFRIRNPAAQQVLYLPDGPEYTNTMDFAFNSSTRECKVVCCCWENNEVDSTEASLKIITVGKDEQWRTLILPNQSLMNARGEFVLKVHFSGVRKVEGVVHLTQIIRLTAPDYYLQVQSLDVWRECFTTTTLPQGVFVDLTKVRGYTWNNCTSVVDMTEETLNILALEDFKEHKWSKNKIKIPLKVLKDCHPHLRDRTVSAAFELLFGASYDFKYNKRKGIVTKATLRPSGERLHKPSLMTLRGMKSE